MTKAKQEKKKVLFICTHNSGRSQMAEGLMNNLLGEKYFAQSAGTAPTQVNSIAVEVMSEIGINIMGSRSKNLERFIDQDFDYVVTVCDHANETCPFFPGGRQRIHKGFKDPAAVTGDPNVKRKAFRLARDEIKEWIIAEFEV